MTSKHMMVLLFAALAILTIAIFEGENGDATPQEDSKSGCDRSGCHSDSDSSYLYDAEVSVAPYEGNRNHLKVSITVDDNEWGEFRSAEASDKGNGLSSDPVYASFTNELEGNDILDIQTSVDNGDIVDGQEITIWAGYEDEGTWHFGELTYVYEANDLPVPDFRMYDIGGTMHPIDPTLHDYEYEDGKFADVYEVFWGDTIRLQSEAYDPGNEGEPQKGITRFNWDYLYTGESDGEFNFTDSRDTLTVGQNDEFVYDRDHYLTNDGEVVLYDEDDHSWYDDMYQELSEEHHYLIDITEGELDDGNKLFMPPEPYTGSTGIPFTDYLARSRVVDRENAHNDSVFILRVKHYAQRTFESTIRDEFGNDLVVEATVIWRGSPDDVSNDPENITSATPTFLFINATDHPLGLRTDGELGIYYDVDLVGMYEQDLSHTWFCNMSITLPYSREGLEHIGFPETLQEKVRIYAWNEASYKFSKTGNGVTHLGDTRGYARNTLTTRTITELMPLVPLVQTVYDGTAKPDFSVARIFIDPDPAPAGSTVYISAEILNNGSIHSYSVPVRIQNHGVSTKNIQADCPAGSTCIVTIPAIDGIREYMEFDVTVTVDRDNYIQEIKEGNNQKRRDISVDVAVSIAPSPALIGEPIRFAGPGYHDGYAWHSSIDGEFFNGTDYTFKDSNLSAGNHSISYMTMNGTGVWTEADVFSLVVHEQPIASIVSLSPDRAFVNWTTLFTGNGSDDGTITRYSWRSDIDGILYNGTNASFGYRFVTPENHTIFLQVMDDNDAWSNEVNLSVRVYQPNNIPEVAIGSPGDDTIVSGTITVSGSASDLDGDETLHSIQIRTGSDEWQTVTGTGSWNFQWDTTNHANGEVAIVARAFDGYNYSDEKSISVTIDNNEQPTVSITSPLNGTTTKGTETVSGTARDPDGTIQTVEIRIGDGEWQTVTGTSTWTFSWKTKTAVNGQISISVRAFDGSDYSEQEELTVTVDNQASTDDDSDDDFEIAGMNGIALLGGGGAALLFIIGAVAFAFKRNASRKPSDETIQGSGSSATSTTAPATQQPTVQQTDLQPTMQSQPMQQQPLQSPQAPQQPPQQQAPVQQQSLQQQVPVQQQQPLQQQVPVQQQQPLQQQQPVQQTPYQQQTVPSQVHPIAAQPTAQIGSQQPVHAPVQSHIQTQTPVQPVQAQPATTTAAHWACPKCGSAMDGQFRFCTSCGTQRAG